MTLEESSKDEDTVYTAGDVNLVISKSDDETAGTVQIDYRKSPHGEGFFIEGSNSGSGCSSCSSSCGSK